MTKPDNGQEIKPGWKTLPEGDVLEAGTAAEFKTGSWRLEKPVWDEEKCIQCMFCWINCPDAAIILKDGKVSGVNYDHCKGCGICAKECPPKASALKMEK
ncbi:MAG: 4Fe-4S binding protein [Endomicrobiia bacterium]|nr:4Fe-4S binding protein [Endomicrobiia bacterium]